MKNELYSAANFLTHIVSLKNVISKLKLLQFCDCLIEVFYRRYQNHWHPALPNKESGYRVIRIHHHHMDIMIIQAAEAAKLDLNLIRELLPSELTLWIDPNEVSYRIGEHGKICVIYNPNFKPWVTRPY